MTMENPKLLFAHHWDIKYFKLTVICKKQSEPKQARVCGDSLTQSPFRVQVPSQL